MADSVGAALVVVLDALTPAERLAFVLHDLFGMPFDDIASMLDKSAAATRQLASRARRRVRGAQVSADIDRSRQRAIVDAFLKASREGDFAALVSVLAPDAALRADPAAVSRGVAPETRGAEEVARTFAGRARAARLALVDGAPGAVWTVRGEPAVVFSFTVAGDTIDSIDLIADPEAISGLDLEVL